MLNGFYNAFFYTYIFSLIKLVFCYACKFQDIPSMTDIKYAVKRNFSGLQEVDTWKIFKSYLLHTISKVYFIKSLI